MYILIYYIYLSFLLRCYFNYRKERVIYKKLRFKMNSVFSAYRDTSLVTDVRVDEGNQPDTEDSHRIRKEQDRYLRRKKNLARRKKPTAVVDPCTDGEEIVHLGLPSDSPQWSKLQKRSTNSLPI